MLRISQVAGIFGLMLSLSTLAWGRGEGGDRCWGESAVPKNQCFGSIKMLSNIELMQPTPGGVNPTLVWNSTVSGGLFQGLLINAPETNYLSLPVRLNAPPHMSFEELSHKLQNLGLSGRVYRVQIPKPGAGGYREMVVAFTDLNQASSALLLADSQIGVRGMPWMASSAEATLSEQYQVLNFLEIQSTIPEWQFSPESSVEARRALIDRVDFKMYLSSEAQNFVESRVAIATTKKPWTGRVTLTDFGLQQLYLTNRPEGNILLMSSLFKVEGHVASFRSETTETIMYGLLNGLISSFDVEPDASYGSRLANPMPRGW